jgi:hypothetical protein
MVKNILLAVVALALGACSTLEGARTSLEGLDLPDFKWGEGRTTTIPQGQCPAVARVAELSSLYQFTNPAQPMPTAAISTAHLSRVDSVCTKQGGNIKISLALQFSGALGPAGRMRPTDRAAFVYPYFVAIIDPQNNIVSKEIMALSMAYDAQVNQLRQTETMTQLLPLDGIAANRYRILVGFQLGRDEVAYNRTLADDQLGVDLVQTSISTGGR